MQFIFPVTDWNCTCIGISNTDFTGCAGMVEFYFLVLFRAPKLISPIEWSEQRT